MKAKYVRMLNKIGLGFNLPFWAPPFAKTGIPLYAWFLWFWSYKKKSFFAQGKERTFYCFRILGWQFQTI